jgi:hypothetical protein
MKYYGLLIKAFSQVYLLPKFETFPSSIELKESPCRACIKPEHMMVSRSLEQTVVFYIEGR